MTLKSKLIFCEWNAFYFIEIKQCIVFLGTPGIINILQERGVKYVCTCTTGIACALYEECSAQTIHSFAGIGLCRGPKEEILRNIMSHEECVKRLRETYVLLIDKISMLSKRTFEIIQYVSQNVRNSDLAFSGIHTVIQVLAFGDFLQLLLLQILQTAFKVSCGLRRSHTSDYFE